MIPVPIFHFLRHADTASGFTIRTGAFSAAGVFGAAACIWLYRRRRHQAGAMPPRHPDRAVKLSDEDRAVWEGIEDGWLGDVGAAIFDQEGPS